MREHESGGPGDGDREEGADGGNAGGQISRWEWLTAGAGLLLVLCALGYLGYEAVAGDDRPPSMVVARDSVTIVRGGHLVHFTVRNQGDRAGAGVVVEGRVAGTGAGSGETSEVTLDYVPGRSTRSGGLFFSTDPDAGGLELRAFGYAVP